MKACRGFKRIDAIVILVCIVFVMLTAGAIGRGGREYARMVVCSSHLRQLGLATYEHAVETGYMPVYGIFLSPSSPHAFSDPIVGPSPGGIPWVTDWYDPCCFGTPGACLIRGGSLEDANVFDQACPTSSSTIRLSYGFNYLYLGGSTTAGPGYRKDGKEWIKLSTVQIPAETGMYCDGTRMNDSGASEEPYSGSWGIYPWEPGLWPDYWDYTSYPNYWTRYAIIGHRAGKLINISFADGHIGAMPPKELHCPWYTHNFDVHIWKRDKRLSAVIQR